VFVVLAVEITLVVFVVAFFVFVVILIFLVFLLLTGREHEVLRADGRDVQQREECGGFRRRQGRASRQQGQTIINGFQIGRGVHTSRRAHSLLRRKNNSYGPERQGLQDIFAHIALEKSSPAMSHAREKWPALPLHRQCRCAERPFRRQSAKQRQRDVV